MIAPNNGQPDTEWITVSGPALKSCGGEVMATTRVVCSADNIDLAVTIAGQPFGATETDPLTIAAGSYSYTIRLRNAGGGGGTCDYSISIKVA